jgi:hypothetical protein
LGSFAANAYAEVEEWLSVQCLMPMREHPTNRKSKYISQMQAALCSWLRKGCSYKDACAMEGISYETFRTWQSEKSMFSVAIKKRKPMDRTNAHWCDFTFPTSKGMTGLVACDAKLPEGSEVWWNRLEPVGTRLFRS